MKSILIAALMLCVTVATAQTTTINRYDGSAKGYATLGVITPEVEVWGLYFGAPYEEYEVGRFLPAKAGKVSLLLGGYLAYQPVPRQTYLLPWAIANRSVGAIRLHAELAYYQPVGAGTPVLWGNEISANAAVAKGVEVGLMANFWQPDGQKAAWGIGPKASLALSKSQRLNVRALFPTEGPAVPNYRAALVSSF